MSKQDTTAARLVDDNFDLIIRHGSDASSPVEIYGRGGWQSTPFQFADCRCLGGYHVVEMLAGWQAGDCGAEAATAAIVYDDGSAKTFTVEFDKDEDGDSTVGAYDDEEIQYQDEYTEALEPYGDFACGNDIVGAADAWRDAGFDADDIGEWLDARVWDADAAASLRDVGITAEQIFDLTWEDLGYLPEDDVPVMDSVGYAIANGSVSIDTVRDALQVAHD